MNTTQAPSLFGNETLPLRPSEPIRQAKTLVDVMYDGFYLLFMLKNRQAPSDAATFRERVRSFLDAFERDAKRLAAGADDIYAAKYAFCAAVDETILASQFSVRQEWERAPLQLAFFGDQLAGEHFFVQLEALRERGASRVQALEVFYLCLLLGFKGKYLLDSPEKLNYLIARVGDEIAHHKGKRAPFAPYWKLPDQVRHTLRSELPLWIIVAAFALLGLLAYLGMARYLSADTAQALSGYDKVVQLAPRAANLTITLP